MNFGQTLVKYAPVTYQTVAEKGSKHVGISGMILFYFILFILYLSSDTKIKSKCLKDELKGR